MILTSQEMTIKLLRDVIPRSMLFSTDMLATGMIHFYNGDYIEFDPVGRKWIKLHILLDGSIVRKDYDVDTCVKNKIRIDKDWYNLSFRKIKTKKEILTGKDINRVVTEKRHWYQKLYINGEYFILFPEVEGKINLLDELKSTNEGGWFVIKRTVGEIYLEKV